MSKLLKAGEVKCAVCGDAVGLSQRFCSTCSTDCGFPNVRVSDGETELAALKSRFESAQGRAAVRGLEVEFAAVVSLLESRSHVVVAMPAMLARQFLFDKNALYTNYESMVGSGSRKPSSLPNDSTRAAVGGRLFGSFAAEIRYGVLSLDGRGLRNYGDVFLRLRDVAIQHRVSFLETNSYEFLRCVTNDQALPDGYRCSWQHRHMLGAAKLEPALEPTETERQTADRLVKDGATRAQDEFIEAHLYGSFSAEAVESIECVDVSLDRATRMDIRIVKERWSKTKKGAK